LAEADTHAPFRQEFDESTDMAGKPIPGFLCRVLTPESVLLALHDRAPQINVHDDRLTLTGHKFYCTIRANHSVARGNWYFETKILDMPEGAATRIGWSQRNANLQAPLGFDKFGYSCRSKKGTKFHEGIGKHYSDGYGQVGDIIGCAISLPEIRGYDYLPACYKDKPLVKFKSHLYFEEKDRLTEALKSLKTLPRSKITFFKNGVSLGTAFTDLYMVR
jgi:Set1/Ash2 histone methyltransferase complex subunit ASH2